MRHEPLFGIFSVTSLPDKSLFDLMAVYRPPSFSVNYEGSLRSPEGLCDRCLNARAIYEMTVG